MEIPEMVDKDTFFCVKKTVRCGGQLLDLSAPKVMGILNVTPDSFYDGGRYIQDTAFMTRASQMLEDGAAIIDLGAVSTRPGAGDIPEAEERLRLLPAVKRLRKEFPGCLISVDTYRAAIALEAVNEGANIINDVSGGAMDTDMLATAGRLKVPYICMHMQGMPVDMQKQPHYNDVVKEVLDFFISKVQEMRFHGIDDIIIDPGFGFGKTVEHNYTLLDSLSLFRILEVPILVGLSRKSMINKVLQTKPENALNGTTVLNTLAIQNGAVILRVHDIKEAVEAIKLVGQLDNLKKMGIQIPS